MGTDGHAVADRQAPRAGRGENGCGPDVETIAGGNFAASEAVNRDRLADPPQGSQCDRLIFISADRGSTPDLFLDRDRVITIESGLTDRPEGIER